MCNFVSWLEVDGEYLWLTDDKLDDKSLKGLPDEDLVGHGAVRRYYGITRSLKQGETLSPLPPPIVADLRKGKMKRLMQMGGYKEFHVNDSGQLHRDDGPAMVWADGPKEWYKDGQLHRDDGPAIVRADGSKMWYKNGQLHRKDGPAMVRADGTKVWYKNGKLQTAEAM